MEAPGKTQHKVVLLFWLLKLPWCICFSFAVIYLALLLSAVYTPPPPPLRHQLPSPFPHGEHLLWEMYSLEDNKGLIGKTSLWAVCWKQAKRQRERMWWHYTPDVFTQVVALIFFFFSSLSFLFDRLFTPRRWSPRVQRIPTFTRLYLCDVGGNQASSLHSLPCKLKTISFYYGCCDFVSIRATSGEDIFTFN